MENQSLQLDDGSRVAVIGGGPAGSFFSFFLLDMADRMGMDLDVDIYEPRDFSRPGPSGCNMCGGIVSESLVQMLAAEGINLPPTVVQRGIDSYTLHMDVGSVRIETPLYEKRIGAVFLGPGPRDIQEIKWPGCKTIDTDNRIGKVVFFIADQIKKRRFARRALLRMVLSEQEKEGQLRRMSMVQWDMYTGSATYRDIFLRTLHPAFWLRFLWDNVLSVITGKKEDDR